MRRTYRKDQVEDIVDHCVSDAMDLICESDTRETSGMVHYVPIYVTDDVVTVGSDTADDPDPEGECIDVWRRAAPLEDYWAPENWEWIADDAGHWVGDVEHPGPNTYTSFYSWERSDPDVFPAHWRRFRLDISCDGWVDESAQEQLRREIDEAVREALGATAA